MELLIFPTLLSKGIPVIQELSQFSCKLLCALWPWIPFDMGKQNTDSVLFLVWPKQTDCGLNMSLYICICLGVLCLVKYYNILSGTARFYSWADRPLSTGRTHVILMKTIFQNVEIQNLSIISKASSMEIKYNWVEFWKAMLQKHG